MLEPNFKPEVSKSYTIPSLDSAEPENATLPAVSSDEEEKACVQSPSKGKMAPTALAKSSLDLSSRSLSGKKHKQSGSPTSMPPDQSLQMELCMAVQQGDIQTVESLLARGGKVHTSPGDSVDYKEDPFLLAVWYQREDMLGLLSVVEDID